MLTHISIQNFTIVKSLALDFSSGLSVLTGETGAGKSIWIDAISLALGHRADSSFIHQEQERCDITVCFDLSNIPQASEWLAKNELNRAEECIIRRTLYREGASRSSINGIPCPLTLVREFAPLILNLHSQHQHQSLLRPDLQRNLLDNFAKNTTHLKDIKQLYQQWQAIKQQITTLQQRMQNRDTELEFLRYQLQEFTDLDFKKNEWQELTEQHQYLHNAKHLIQQASQALELTVDNEQASAVLLLQQALNHLNEIKHTNKQIQAIKTLLNTAMIHVQEAGVELQRYCGHVELNTEHLTTIEQRLTVIHDLARKHHVHPNDLFELQQSLQQKLSQLQNSDTQLASLVETQTLLLKRYQTIAQKLTINRQNAADELNKEMSKIMNELGIKGGSFKVILEPSDAEISSYGNEHINFLVNTNPGQSLQPLNKIVSGGELSRISLALQVLAAQKDHLPTLIFDEVDAGIGGQTANVVGNLLRRLGTETQVLCITHLPQVAAQAQHHFKVSKKTTEQTTTISIKNLSRSERVEELARMLSGHKITPQILGHAEQLLN